MSTRNYTRILMFAGVGIGLSLLVIAGYYLGSTLRQPAQTSLRTVATVNDHEISDDYVQNQIAKLPVGQQTPILMNRDRFIESLIQEEVLFQYALSTNFNNDIEFRDHVKDQVVAYLIDKEVAANRKVSESQIEAYYQNNQSTIREEHVAAAHILLANLDECEKLLAEIKNENDFRKFAAERSLDDNTATDGGHLGLFMNHGGELGFEEKLFAMKVGELRIFETSRGCHIVRLTDHVVPPLPPLEEVSDRIRQLLEIQNEREALSDLLSRSADRVDVTRIPQP